MEKDTNWNICSDMDRIHCYVAHLVEYLMEIALAVITAGAPVAVPYFPDHQHFAPEPAELPTKHQLAIVRLTHSPWHASTTIALSLE